MNIQKFRKNRRHNRKRYIISHIQAIKSLISNAMSEGRYSAKMNGYRDNTEMVAIRYLLIKYNWLMVSNIKGNGCKFSWK